MITIFNKDEIIKDLKGNYYPKKDFGGLQILSVSDGTAVIEDGKFIVLKSKNITTDILLETISIKLGLTFKN